MMLYQDILDEIIRKSKNIFNQNLTGIYLHGSMAMRCFNPKKSDLDLIVVIEKEIADEQKLRFMEAIIRLNESAPHKGIELSIIKKEYCNDFVYPTPFELHFSSMHLQWFKDNPVDYISKMKGADKDLAAHFMIIKKCGIVLWGAEIERVFSEIPKECYMDSIWSDIENAKEDIKENPIYIILNLCRVAAFVKDNIVVSKKQGGEWGLQNLSPEYKNLILDAVNCYSSEKEMDIDERKAQQFCDDVLFMIKRGNVCKN